MTLPWLLQSGLNYTLVPARSAPPRDPKANGVHRNNGIHRKNSPWANGARRFYGSCRKDALAFPRPARLLWRPTLGRHLQVQAEGRWNRATRDRHALSKRQLPANFLRFSPQSRGGKHLFSALFQHSRFFPLLSPVPPETKRQPSPLARPF